MCMCTHVFHSHMPTNKITQLTRTHRPPPLHTLFQNTQQTSFYYSPFYILIP